MDYGTFLRSRGRLDPDAPGEVEILGPVTTDTKPAPNILGLNQSMKDLYERLRTLPFPNLGKRVGDFALYDALLAGCADRASRGGCVECSEVPVPAEETVNQVELLRKKDHISAEESAFLQYFDVLEQLRVALERSKL
ncbi:MAG: hypothetical protein GY835_12775 [bacterium]|nr:hypothetical protein [bacterium]